METIDSVISHSTNRSTRSAQHKVPLLDTDRRKKLSRSDVFNGLFDDESFPGTNLRLFLLFFDSGH